MEGTARSVGFVLLQRIPLKVFLEMVSGIGSGVLVWEGGDPLYPFSFIFHVSGIAHFCIPRVGVGRARSFGSYTLVGISYLLSTVEGTRVLRWGASGLVFLFLPC
jgi:hypothetical protein